MIVYVLCETQCQQVSEFFCALVYLFNHLHTYKVPPVPTYMVENGLCAFGYCFSCPLLQCSFGQPIFLWVISRESSPLNVLQIWPLHPSIEASVAHHIYSPVLVKSQ